MEVTRFLIFLLVWNCEVFSQEIFVSNLDENCFACLCFAASNCDASIGCADGYCGIYQIGMSYWIDAGGPTLINDIPNTISAFKNCALSRYCAKGIIRSYLSRYGQDCNGDGITNCDDYVIIQNTGGYNCTNQSFEKLEYWKRYKNCKRKIKARNLI